jgi:hypothetical protein
VILVVGLYEVCPQSASAAPGAPILAGATKGTVATDGRTPWLNVYTPPWLQATIATLLLDAGLSQD